MSQKLKFTEGEKVLCYHGPLLYEAKCIKSQVKDKTVRYYIHYSGWNKNWDEWVPEGRVLKFNEANLKQKEELSLSCNSSKKTKSGTKKDKETSDKDIASPQEKSIKKQKESMHATSPSTSTADVEKKKKIRSEQNVKIEGSVTEKTNGEINIPDGLKIWLIRGMKKVGAGYLVKIPARKTVEKILEEYANYRKSEGLTLNQETEMNEIISGIRLYFNTMLQPLLLSKVERPQHADLMSKHPDSKPSDLYGSFHLLRLFTKIGHALSFHPYDPKSWALLENGFDNFLKYLNNESRSLFSTALDFESELVEKT